MKHEIKLQKNWFCDKEKDIFVSDGLKASLFRYPSGIEAIRLTNSRGYMVILPYAAHRIWEMYFDGRQIGMSSRFEMPMPAETIFETYGCFMYHCGALRVGNPMPGDTYKVHGELPTANYLEASLVFESDDNGRSLSVAGLFPYRMGFGDYYDACPVTTMRPDSGMATVAISIRNLSPRAMDLMYMCHLNFRPVMGAELVQPAAWTPDEMILRSVIPSHVKATQALKDRMERMEKRPETTRVFKPEDSYDPEAVFFLRKVKPGKDGLARFLQVLPSGHADMMAYDPAVLTHHVRWIFIDENSQAIGMIPGTCEPDGYAAEKEKGNLRSLAGNQSVTFVMHAGALDSQETAKARQLV